MGSTEHCAEPRYDGGERRVARRITASDATKRRELERIVSSCGQYPSGSSVDQGTLLSFSGLQIFRSFSDSTLLVLFPAAS